MQSQHIPIDAERLKKIQFGIYEHNLIRVFEIFRENQIEPILIKGWANARFYPEPYKRRAGDYDLAVEAKKYKKAAALVREIPELITVDLHKELRHHDSVSFKDLFANSTLVSLKNAQIRVLRAEDNLRVNCVHWLTDGGREYQKFWDVYYCVANRPPDFDWNRCLKIVSKTRQKWILTMLALTHRYLDLDISDTPAAGYEQQIPDWIIKTIESEWKEDRGLVALEYCLKDRKLLIEQIRKRIFPNPIHATVMCEAEFNESPRLPYQIINIFSRIPVTFRRNLNKIR